MAGGDLAGDERTAADLGAWLVVEDKSGQGLQAAKGPHLGPAGGRRPRPGLRKELTEAHYAALLAAAHQQLDGPIMLVGGNLNTHVRAAREKIIAVRPWLTVFRLSPYAHELNPVARVWSHRRRSLANLKHDIAALTVLVRARLERMQCRPGLLAGFLASTGLDLGPVLQLPPSSL